MNEDQEELINSSTPENALDFNMLNINSVWGRNEIPIELKEALTQKFNYIDVNNKEQEVKKSNWNLLGFFTRDFRLGNLDKAIPRQRAPILCGRGYCEHSHIVHGSEQSSVTECPSNLSATMVSGPVVGGSPVVSNKRPTRLRSLLLVRLVNRTSGYGQAS